MCVCNVTPVAGLTFSILLMFFCLVWWLSYKFESILTELKNLKELHK